jgi:hypothetical protein
MMQSSQMPMFLAVGVCLAADAVAENMTDAVRPFRFRGNSARDTSRRLSDGFTSLTNALNDQIAASPGGAIFRGGGKGILIRAPDFFDNGDTKVVPATFWSNDIYAPSGVYPGNQDQNGAIPGVDPWCPLYYDDGYGGQPASGCDDAGLCGPYGSWDYAQMAYVVGSSMYDMFPDYDNIQSDDWGWGVFYPFDANAADKRCRYDDSNDGWDCPGGWMDADGSFTADPSKKGAGYYEPGNPDAGYEGGGAGCHFQDGDNVIDQDDAYADDQNLVQDKSCQCNYIFSDDWGHWVQTWMANRDSSKYDPDGRPWFQGGAQAPTWGMDVAACWMNNPTDMIFLQNAIWAAAGDWNNQRAPLSDWKDPAVDGDVAASVSNRVYWGWNEIPVGASIDQPEYWDAVMIKLPANVCEDDSLGGADYIECLKPCAQQQLENDIEQWVIAKKLVVGEENAGNRPGSSVVIAREYYVSSTGRYQRYFFCEDWTSPSEKYKIRYNPDNDDCFVEAL